MNCCFCEQVALGLPGCDTFLDTFYLHDQIDRTLIGDAAYGLCHAACLVASPWSEVWQARIATNLFSVRRLHDISNGQQILGWNRRTSEFAIVYHGRFFWVSHDSVALHRDGVEATLDEEVCWTIGDAALSRSIQRQLESHGSAEGRPVIAQLSMNAIYDELTCPRLLPFADDAESTMTSLNKGAFEGRVHYSLQLEPSIASFIVAQLTQ